MRPMTPAHASIASLSVVLPDDAWPTMAKFRRSPAEEVVITQIRSCSKHRIRHTRKLKISGSFARALWSDIAHIARRRELSADFADFRRLIRGQSSLFVCSRVVAFSDFVIRT